MKQKLSLMKQNILINYFLLLLGLFFTSSFFAQDVVKNHYSAKGVVLFDKNTYDLSTFEQRKKVNVNLDLLKLIDEKYLEHPDLGYSVHPNEKDAIELVDKRDFYKAAYQLPDGKTIFSSSISPLNYIDKDGWFREIKHNLDANPINNVYRAGQQAIPKTIDASSGKTTFETPLGNISINQNSKVRFINGHDEIGQVHFLNTSSKQIGENGLFVSNAYPNIDMQVVLMKNGYVKTNYIIKDRSAINAQSEYMVFEDIITLPKGMRIDFDTERGINNGVEQDWEGSLVIRNEKNEDVFHYMIPFIYDNNYTVAMMDAPNSSFSMASSSYEDQGVNSDAFTNSSYRVEKINDTTYKISVVVKSEWLLASERTFPIVVDPVTFTGVTLTYTAGDFCARRVSGTMPIENPGPTGVGCHSSTVVLPAGYMLVASMPVRLWSGYKTRGCAASSTWMKFYGPCGYEPVAAGFYYFCNTNLTNVDCGAPAGGTSLNDILSRCTTTGGGELCATATPPSCSNRTLTFSVCYQTRCFSNAAGTCATTSTQFPTGTNASYVEAGIANFRVDIIGEKITTTLTGSPVTGSNICPGTVVPLTLGTRFGVPNALSTSNCTDQMGGTYTSTTTATGGTLSASTNAATNNTGGFAGGGTWTAPATAGTYTITNTICNTNCTSPTSVMCDTKTLTYIVGNAIAPLVTDLTACDGVSVTAAISNLQAGYTYTWYLNATGTLTPTTGNTRIYAAVNGTTQTYSVRATSPCASTLTTFTITWGPLPAPTGTNDAKCPGGIAELLANCGTTCRWYTVASGGTALTTAAPITIGTGSLTVNPVSSNVTYYVENWLTSSCISARIPLTISTNGLIVTTNPTSFNPLCNPTTAQFTSSVTGHSTTASQTITNSSSNLIEDNSPCTGPDCLASNSGALTVATPTGVESPLTAASISKVCFDISTGWCGKEMRWYLMSPSGLVFTLFAGTAKGTTAATETRTFCFDDLATGTIPNAKTTPAGTYLASGGVLSDAFVGSVAAAGSLWTIYAVDPVTGGCGNATASISNFSITFGVTQQPTFSWSGTPGTRNFSNISNPIYTPPVGNYSSTQTVTVTDAAGCTGTAIVLVSCTILPIELISFYGELGEQENYLFWSTASEKNSNYFELQRSENGVDFTKTGSVQAAENSTTLKEYNFTDKKRLVGMNYYRLKMVDLNGEYKYSDLTTLENQTKEITIEIIPNPASSYIDILFQLIYASPSSIKIFDSKGSLIEKIEFDSEKGLNSHKVNLENYANGVYSVMLNNNGNIITKRFIKQ